MKIDARGQACPQPVILTKTAIETQAPKNLTIIVDNPASQENVKRFLRSQGYETELKEEKGLYYTTGSRETAPEPSRQKGASPSTGTTMVFCPDMGMGKGDEGLGEKLMISFISTLKEMGNDLWRIALVNSGVKLTISGSPVLPALKELEDQGVSILVCGTCLTHFDLLEQKKVGETTNMLDIVTSMQVAEKVIRV